tara:strand:+ start:16023 stop:17108 length:1086 start_codon:yes stop_codon:yes gene_type:complete
MEHDIPMKPYGPTAGREHANEKPRPKKKTVDFHIHMRIPEADDVVGDKIPNDSNVQLRFADKASREQSIKHHQERWPYLTDMNYRLPDMEKMQVDVAALSCAPKQFYYSTESTLGYEASQAVNDGLYKAVSANKGTHIGLGTVPLQDTDLAIKELKRCINELGFKGLQIGARVKEDEELSSERLYPFWEAVQELNVPMLIHPSSFSSPRLAKYHMMNIIGNPLDTTVGVHYLIFGGVMEKFPNLKFVLSHGGAFASHYFARMDHAYGARPDCREDIRRKPSYYLSKFYFDTLVFSVEQLSTLVQNFGPDHILLGTDYPYDMGEFDPVEHVCQVPGLSEQDRENICGQNAMNLMGIDDNYFK